MKNIIPFNKPYTSNLELNFFKILLKNKNFSARGYFSQKCENILEKKYQRHALLTKSCTNALETIAYLLELKKGG